MHSSSRSPSLPHLRYPARVLRELQLEEPIRYGENDPIEKWLNDLLCLDATVSESYVSRVPACVEV